MKLETFVLCDAATETAGKLNILGQFDTLVAPIIPAVHPAMTVAMRTRFARSEVGEHRFKLTIVDEDGRAMIPPLEGTVAVQLPDGDDSSVNHLFLNLNGMPLGRYGSYSVDFFFDGKQKGSIPFFVKPPRAKTSN